MQTCFTLLILFLLANPALAWNITYAAMSESSNRCFRKAHENPKPCPILVTPCSTQPNIKIDSLKNYKPKFEQAKKNQGQKFLELKQKPLEENQNILAFREVEEINTNKRSFKVGFDGKIEFTNKNIDNGREAKVTVTSHYIDGVVQNSTTATQTLILKKNEALVVSGYFCPDFYGQNKIIFENKESLLGQLVDSHEKLNLHPTIFIHP